MNYSQKLEVSANYHKGVVESCKNSTPLFKNTWPLLLQGYSFALGKANMCYNKKDFVLPNRRMKPQSGDLSTPILCVESWLLFVLFCALYQHFAVVMYVIRVLSLFALMTHVLYSIVRFPFKQGLRPQAGELEKMDPYLKEAIQVWCLCESLKNAKTKTAIVAAVVQYLQAHTTQSLPLYLYRRVQDWQNASAFTQVENMLDEAFGEAAIKEYEDELVLECQDGMEWSKMIDTVFSDFKRIRKSAMAERFCRFINIVVAAGMCSRESLTFDLGKINLFTPMVEKKQLDACDVLDVCYEAISGFVRGGWRVFSTGDISAFFREEGPLNEFEELYEKIRTFNAYALAGNLRKECDIDENDFEELLNTAIEQGKQLARAMGTKTTFEKKYVSDRLDRLLDYQAEFLQTRIKGGLRIAPYAVSLYGRSGCGKSSLTSLSVNSILTYNGFSCEKDRIATWADNDKFASNIRSHVNAIIFDDFANTKSEFMDFSPAYRLIQVINNVRYLAPMAELHLKGKVSLNPYVCVVSTNVRDLCAQQYSNEPGSILRRLLHVTVEPKQEYCGEDGKLSSKKIVEKFGITAVPDVWNLSVFTYNVTDESSSVVYKQAFEPVVHQGKALTKISVMEYLDWLQDASKQHFADQETFVATQEETPTVCTECGKAYCCSCKGLQLQPHAGFYDKCHETAVNWYEQVQARLSVLSTSAIIQQEQICMAIDRFNVLPDSLVCHPIVLNGVLFFLREDIKRSLMYLNSVPCISYLFWLYYFPITALWCFPLLVVCCVILSTAYTASYRLMIKQQILQRADVVKTFIEEWKIKYALIGIVGLGMLYTFLRRMMKSNMTPHSALDPTNDDEVQERNDAVNPWIGVERVPLPRSMDSSTTSCEALGMSIRPNFVGVVSEIGKTTMGFYVCSNFLMIPKHFVEAHEGDFEITVYRNGKHVVGSKFTDVIAREFTVQVGDSDFMISYVTNGGSNKDILRFLPLAKNIPTIPAQIVTRNLFGDEVSMSKLLLEPSRSIKHSLATFWGCKYTTSFETKGGMCMSPIISNMKGAVLVGFHIAGLGRLGACGVVTKAEVQTALDVLSSYDGVIMSASMGNFSNERHGKKVVVSDDIHAKSATRFLEEGSNIEVYGSMLNSITPRSHVTETLISKTVEEVLGVPQQWGPPKMSGPGRYPFQASLVHSANPSKPLGSIMKRAVCDYKGIVKEIRNNIPSLFKCGPLDRVATVSGLKGVKFIDAMNFNTSPGFPFSGSKHPLLVDLPADEHPHVGCPRTFCDEVWNEFDEALTTLRHGERFYAIWKACLKDEPTKLTKDKVRVFQSAPLVVQLMIRMYFLPIVRIIQMNPLKFECAVGVNAEGLEWQELWDHAMKKGGSRVLAGDYSKYDLRMPAQVTSAAFDVLIDIADKCEGYSADDIFVMKQLAHEVVYPMIAYNGDLIQLFGGNPSGQNLTVIINSIVNSLLLRCCFYTVYEKERVFQDHCSFITYGDDVIGTVSERCPKFNHLVYAQYLKEHDMGFTMPDKSSTPTEWMEEEDVDFLKRKCRFNPDLGVKVGLLSEESIFKRLHSHIASKELSREMHSAQNIDSSLHDWFYYGRVVFDERRAQLSEIAEKAGIKAYCAGLNIDYDTRVTHWRHKYLGEDLPQGENEDILECQSGELESVSAIERNESPLYQFCDMLFTSDFHCCGTDMLVLDPAIGEIDKLYKTCFKGRYYYVIVEIKKSSSVSTRKKAKSQLRKYVTMLSILQPQSSILGLFLDPERLECFQCYGSMDTWDWLYGKCTPQLLALWMRIKAPASSESDAKQNSCVVMETTSLS
jgi:hypothetical protein